MRGLIKGAGNDAFRCPLGTEFCPSRSFSKAEDPAIQAAVRQRAGPCVDFVTMNTQRIKDPDVRHAIALALDRQGIQKIYGGEIYGSIAESVIPADVAGVCRARYRGWRRPPSPPRRGHCLEGKALEPCAWR